MRYHHPQELAGREHGILQAEGIEEANPTSTMVAQPPLGVTSLGEGMVFNPDHPPRVRCLQGAPIQLQVPLQTARNTERT